MRQQLYAAVAWLGIGVLVVGVLLLVVRTSTLAATNAATLDAVRDCTTPGRACYERGRRTTAAAVADITRISVYAAACADQPGRQSARQIEACITRRLNRGRR